MEIHVQDFFDFARRRRRPRRWKAKKCHGCKLGSYELVSRVVSGAGDSELLPEVRATLPVTENRKPLKHVEVEVDATSTRP